MAEIVSSEKVDTEIKMKFCVLGKKLEITIQKGIRRENK